MARLSYLIILLLFSLILGACAENSAPMHRHPYAMAISMDGVADTLVVPDRVVWTVTMNDLDADLQAAKSGNDTKLDAVLAALEQVDGVAGSVSKGPARIQRQYRRCDDGVNRFSHFSVKRVVTFRQDDLDAADATLDRLVTVADLEIAYHYEVADPEAIMRQLRNRATDQARAKIDAIAEHAGLTIGRLLGLHVNEPQHFSRHHDQRRVELTGVAGPQARHMESRVNVRYALE